MLERVEEKDPEGGKEQEAKPAKFSVAEIQKKIMADMSGAVGPSQQRAAILEEMQKLRRAGNNPRQVTADDVQPKSVRKQVVNIQRGHIARLKQQIAQEVSHQSTQHAEVSADLTTLKQQEKNVRSKIDHLENLNRQSQLALEKLQTNKVSAHARATLVTEELKVFEESQRQHVDALRGRLEEDIRAYVDSEMLQEFSYARYLELSFSYRAYQVCLEQDFLRHAAESLKDGDIPADVPTPTALAVQSLNYYEDFFRNLADIEKIWPQAGAEIRKLEIKGVMPAVRKDREMYAVLIGDHADGRYQECCARLEKIMDEYIKLHKPVRLYIASGDGLNMKKHPWTRLGMVRLEQPNQSIDFNEIAAQDQTYPGAVTQVAERVIADEKEQPAVVEKALTQPEEEKIHLRFKTVVDSLIGLNFFKAMSAEEEASKRSELKTLVSSLTSINMTPSLGR